MFVHSTDSQTKEENMRKVRVFEVACTQSQFKWLIKTCHEMDLLISESRHAFPSDLRDDLPVGEITQSTWNTRLWHTQHARDPDGLYLYTVCGNDDRPDLHLSLLSRLIVLYRWIDVDVTDALTLFAGKSADDVSRYLQTES